MTLEHRVAVITGATGGLGAVLTRDLAARGANLVLLDIDSARLDALTSSLALPEERFLAQTVNLLDPSEARRAAEAAAARFGHLDVLLHVVGGWTGGKTLLEVPPTDLERLDVIQRHPGLRPPPGQERLGAGSDGHLPLCGASRSQRRAICHWQGRPGSAYADPLAGTQRHRRHCQPAAGQDD